MKESNTKKIKVNYIKKKPVSLLPVFGRRYMVISFREANQEAEHIKLLHEKKTEVCTKAKISSFFLLHIDEALRCYILASCKVYAFLK